VVHLTALPNTSATSYPHILSSLLRSCLALPLCREEDQIKTKNLPSYLPPPVSQAVLLFPAMLRTWWQIVLTTSQVINLARALPRPQGFGHFANSSSATSHSIGPSPLGYAIEGTGLTGPSPITFTDANLHIQTVTSTDLPPVQTPTTTSATQSWPDTIGVSASAERTLLPSSDHIRRVYRVFWKQKATLLSSHFRQVYLQ
jgi:hypothetical protein